MPGLVDEAAIRLLSAETGRPLNLLAWAGLPGRARLEELGVRRLSAGALLGLAALDRTLELAKAFLADGLSTAFPPSQVGDLNELMRRA